MTSVINSHKSNELTLSTSGLKTRILVNPQETKNVVFTAEKFDNFQTNTGVSRNHMVNMANFIRSSAGRKSIPASYTEHMSIKSKMLEDVYKEGIYEFDTDKGKKEKRPVVWADSEEHLRAVLQHRDQTGNEEIKLMADGGQGFFLEGHSSTSWTRKGITLAN